MTQDEINREIVLLLHGLVKLAVGGSQGMLQPLEDRMAALEAAVLRDASSGHPNQQRSFSYVGLIPPGGLR